MYIGPYRTLFNKDVTITIPYRRFLASPSKVQAFIYNELTKDWEAIEELIAKRATGRYHWENSFTVQQRLEFTDLFSEFLGNNYLTRINGTVKGLKVEYLDEMIDDSGKRAKVRTKVPGSKSDVAVEYSMGLRDGKWKIYDVYVEGVSLVQNYKPSFAAC